MTQFQYNTASFRPTQTAPQRIAGLIFATAVQAGIIYALLMGLGFVPMPPMPTVTNGRVIFRDPAVPLPPPPPIPVIQPPRITDTAPPIVEITVENPGQTAITLPTAPPSQPEAVPQRLTSLEQPPASQLTLTPARAIAATHTIPEYPPVSRRLGEQGTLRLKVAIAADGAVSEAQVERSSGYKRLDEAAIQWVKAHWRYEPALQGAKPVPSMALAELTFKLR